MRSFNGLHVETRLGTRRVLPFRQKVHRYRAKVMSILPGGTSEGISKEAVHTCASDDSGHGLALRFPRMVRFIRKDKSPEDATTVAEIQEMVGRQKKVQL
jgi:hypothetical protein